MIHVVCDCRFRNVHHVTFTVKGMNTCRRGLHDGQSVVQFQNNKTKAVELLPGDSIWHPHILCI